MQELIRDNAYAVRYKSTTVGEYLDRAAKTPYSYGAVGDGVADDTLALQAFFDNETGDLDLGGGTYSVRKNPLLASTYPTEPDFSDGTRNYSPCLALVNKEGIRVFNGTVVVDTHGLDGLALVNCRNVTVSLTVRGPGKFPAIDVPTGYAEKGTVDYGYDTALFTGPNNSVDSSAYTSGTYAGVPGQFPNYDAAGNQLAGWRSTWGPFLGGYIGSWANGIKVQRGCRGILILNSHVSGFNFGGIGIGIRNIAITYGSADYANDTDVPDGVMVMGCTIKDCYSAGIYVLSGYRLNYESNDIQNIGHPSGDDALNDSYDPGYGITHGRNRRIRNVVIAKNQIKNCRRKCIDFHGGGQAIITENMCLEHGVVGIYAKCGPGWAPNYEPYNLIISNNYVRSRDIPASATSGVLAGGKYTRSIDVGGGGEATAATYPQPFVKIHSNYCELRSVNGVAIETGAGDSSYQVYQDIDISHNTVVLKCLTFNNTAEAIIVNAGASASQVYRGQTVKLIGNSVKQYNSLDLSYRAVGYKVQGIPKSLVAHANTLDMNVQLQSAMMCDFVLDSRTNFSFQGNQVVGTGQRTTCTLQECMFYENTKIFRANGSGSLSIPGTLGRGVWQLVIAGTGAAYGSKQTQFASTGSGGTGADIVRNPTTGFIADFAISASGLTVPAVTQDTTVQIQLKQLMQLDTVL